MKKLLSIIISALMILSFIPLSGIALDTNKNSFDIIYNYIKEDYKLITNLNQLESNNIYEEVITNSYNNSFAKNEVHNILYGESKDSTYEKDVLFIQNNYDNILSNIEINEKKLVDEYFLFCALNYYIDNASPEDYTMFATKQNENISYDNSGVKATYVATLTIFSDPTESLIGSSGGLTFDAGRHAWISIKNTSTSNITVGKFTVAPGKTVQVGTWGLNDPHNGIWYNREGYLINKDNSNYLARVSLNMNLSSSSLSLVTNHIINNDWWTKTGNCSHFASSVWNLVSGSQLSAGLIATPKTLANNIKKISGYSTSASVPYNYSVYYANGSNSITQATGFN